MRPFALALLAMSLTGCYGPRNVTHYEPYSEYVDRALMLRRPAFLYKDGSHVHLSDETFAARYRGAVKEPPHIAELPTGTTVWLHKVTRTKDFEGGGYFVDAIGDVRHPVDGRLIRFDFLWGYDVLRRAPWEDESIREDRPAEFIGEKSR